ILLWRSLPEGWAGRRGYSRAFLLGLGAPSAELEVEALLAASHRPAMVGAEDRPEDERPVPEQGLVGPDTPVVHHVDELSLGLKGPHAGADEVALGDEREAIDATRLRDLEPPPKGVRKPALRVEVDDATDVRDRVAREELAHVQVDGRPPALETQRIAQDVSHLAGRALDLPVGDEVVLSGHFLVLEVVGVEQVLLRPLDDLARPHYLDQLLAALRRADHDRAHQAVVLEEELAIELLVEAERAHWFAVCA